MGAAAELFVRVSADVKGLTAGFDDATKAASGLGKGIDTAAGHWVDAQGRMRDASGKFVAGASAAGQAADAAASKISGLSMAAGAAAVIGLGVALGSVAQKAVGLASELEQNQIAFTTMLGSADKAQKMLSDLATFAASTPFEMRGLTDATKRLVAFGFSAESVIPIMNSVGNAVAGVKGGKDALDGITLALGQMAAKGKVSAEEMNQLAERGIPAWKMLAHAIGVSQPEAMKMAEKGAIDAATAISALVNGMNKQFPDMMSKQAQTFGGAMSNLTDSVDQALSQIGKKLIETFQLTRLVQSMSLAINNLTTAFTSGGLIAALDVAFGPATKAAIIGLGAAITTAMFPALIGTTSALGGVTAAIGTAVASAAPFIAVGLAIAAAAYPIIKNWAAIKDVVGVVFDTAAQYVSAWYNRAVRVFSDIYEVVASVFSSINTVIRDTLGVDIAAKLGVGFAKVGGVFTSFKEMAVTGLGIVSDSVSYAAENIAKDFTYAFNEGKKGALSIATSITPAMLGLGKMTAATTSSAAAHRKAEAEARKHAAALERLHAAGAKAYERFESMALALNGLSADLAKAQADADKQGRSFDLAGAKAEAYKSALSGIESAFGKFSPQAIDARAKLEQFTKASENGGAATAKAYGIIDGGTVSLEHAALKAQMLGEAFHLIRPGLQQAQDDMKALIDLGLKPGNAAFDEAAAKLKVYQQAQRQSSISGTGLTDTLTELMDVSKAAWGTFNDLLGAVGIELPKGVTAAASAMFQFGGSLLSVAAQLPALISGMATLTAIIVANPIAAIAGVIALAAVGAIAYLKNARDEAAKTQAEIDKMNAKMAEQELAFAKQWDSWRLEAEANAQIAKTAFDSVSSAASDAIKTASLSFLAGTQDWADKLRLQIREAIFNSVVDMVVSKAMRGQLDELAGQIVNSFQGGLGEGTKALMADFSDKMVTLSKDVSESLKTLFEGAGFAESEVKRLADKAIAAKNKTESDANRNTLIHYQEQLLKEVQRYQNAGDTSSPGYQRVLDEANRVSREIRGLALGGLVTGPMTANLGEGGKNEAVLPLNENVFRQIGQGIAAAGSGGGAQVVVNYTGSGKWTREDAQGLGRLLVSELRAMGVRA